MIEIRKREKPERIREYDLFIDGNYVDSYSYDRKSGLYLAIHDRDISAKLAAKEFSELPNNLAELKLRFDFDWTELIDEVSLYPDLNQQSIQIGFTFNFDVDEWKRLYSIWEYGVEFEAVIAQMHSPEITWVFEDEMMAGGFEVRIQKAMPVAIIVDEIIRCSNIVCDLNERVEKSLASKLRSDSVVMYFDFPQEVRVACEQYLLYFVQFLRDLGIDSTAELQQEVGQVLFAVTPADSETALDKIRTALEVYLRLPSNPVSDFSTNDEIALQRLAANIYHLKSQLTLSRAEIQMNEKTIQAQKYIIGSQQRILDGLISGEIILESAREASA